MSPDPAPDVRLVGGIVAYDDGDQVGAAIDSLLDQELPSGAVWKRVWVVAGGRDPSTVETAEERAARDPRITVLRETERQGKSAALLEVFRRAQGDYLVLVNGDAIAEPGSVAALLRAVPASATPFGIMGRPVVPPTAGPAFYPALALLWALHHEVHAELARRGQLTHLSDELMLLPVSALPPFPEGVICDGSFAAGWILAQGGQLRYATDARVRLTLPGRSRDMIAQRRRIRVGHHRGPEEMAAAFSTVEGLMARDPLAAIRIIVRSIRSVPNGVEGAVALAAAEVLAMGLSRWDRWVRRNYGAWPRVSGSPGVAAERGARPAQG